MLDSCMKQDHLVCDDCKGVCFEDGCEYHEQGHDGQFCTYCLEERDGLIETMRKMYANGDIGFVSELFDYTEELQNMIQKIRIMCKELVNVDAFTNDGLWNTADDFWGILEIIGDEKK
jgi:hypothetical protein